MDRDTETNMVSADEARLDAALRDLFGDLDALDCEPSASLEEALKDLFGGVELVDAELVRLVREGEGITALRVPGEEKLAMFDAWQAKWDAIMSRKLALLGIDEERYHSATEDEQVAMLAAASKEYHSARRHADGKDIGLAVDQLRRLYFGEPRKRMEKFALGMSHLGQALNAFRAARVSRDLVRVLYKQFDMLAWNLDVPLPAFPPFPRWIDMLWHDGTGKRPPDGCDAKQFRDRKEEFGKKLREFSNRMDLGLSIEILSLWRKLMIVALRELLADPDAASTTDVASAADKR